MIKLSIILPIYNAELYIAKCLNSLLEQTFTDFEIICIDDGSVDNSLSIIQEFAKKDARVKWFTQKNQGQSAARNVGILNSTGEYIGFVDADDFVDIDFYERLVHTAQENNADIAQASTRCVGGKSVKVFEQNLGNYTTFVEKISVLNLGSVWDKIFRKSLLDAHNIKFLEGCIWEDNLFAIEAICFANTLSICQNTHYNYVLNNLSTTQNEKNISKKKKDSLVIIGKSLEFSKKYELSKEDILCIEHFLIKNIVSREMLYDEEYYSSLQVLLSNSKYLRKKYYSAKFKRLKKAIKNFFRKR